LSIVQRVIIVTLLVLCVVAYCKSARAAPAYEPLNVMAFDEQGASLSIDDVTVSAASHQFRPLATLPSTNRQIARWYRFYVPKATVPLVLRLTRPVSDADLYFPRSGHAYGVVHIGMRVPFSQRSYPYAWPVARVTATMISSSPLYLKTYVPTATPEFEPEALYVRDRSTLTRGTLFFVGFIAAIGILSLGLFLYLREPMFILHALLMAVSIVYILTSNYLAWQYLWPGAAVDGRFADAATFIAYILAIILFGRSFLSLARRFPYLDRLLWGAFTLNCLFTFVIQPFDPDSTVIAATAPLVNFAPLFLLLIAAVVCLRSGFRQARFFITGFGGMFVIFIVFGSIYSLAHWPANISGLLGSLAFDFGVAFDSLFFQFALADRVLSANRERDEAQRNELSAQQQALATQRTAIETLERHNAAFTRFVPHAFLEQLGRADIVEVQLGDHVEREMGVLFSDIRSFTSLSERMTPRESFEFVNAFFAQVGPVVREHDGFIDKYIGDAVMALFSRRASDAIDAAIAVQREVRRFNEERARVLRVPIAVGIGAHWGKLILGTVGEERRIETTVVSDAVNVAARLQDLTKACAARIVVSGALVNALDDAAGYCLRAIGSFTVPGLSHAISVFEVCDADEPGVIIRKMSTRETFEEALRLYTTGEYERSGHLFESILRNNPDDGAAAYYRERASMDKALPETLT